jgi:hypothetical protein
VNRWLDALEESAAGLIRVCYLLAGVLAVAAYFGDGTVPHSVTALFNAVLPWVLAVALETHTYLTARRVRNAWLTVMAAGHGSDERRRAVGVLKVNLAILAGLLAFSMLNQLQYLSGTWTPPRTGFALPVLMAYVVRAVVVPLAFMAAAFLAPSAESLTAQIKTEAHRFAGATFKVARRQWKSRLREMRRAKQDVTGALIGLVDDADERRVVETIHGVLFTPAVPMLPEPEVQPLPEPPKRPPTGPGSPTTAKANGTRRERLDVLRLTPDRPVKRLAAATYEDKARRVLAQHPDAGKRTLAKLVGCSESTAGRLRKKILVEGAQASEQYAR